MLRLSSYIYKNRVKHITISEFKYCIYQVITFCWIKISKRCNYHNISFFVLSEYNVKETIK